MVGLITKTRSFFFEVVVSWGLSICTVDKLYWDNLCVSVLSVAMDDDCPNLLVLYLAAIVSASPRLIELMN